MFKLIFSNICSNIWLVSWHFLELCAHLFDLSFNFLYCFSCVFRILSQTFLLLSRYTMLCITYASIVMYNICRCVTQ